MWASWSRSRLARRRSDRTGPRAAVAAIALAVVLLSVLGACGDDDATRTETVTDTTTATDSSTTTVVDESTSTTTAAGALPGESFDLGPSAGADLSVISVRFDDTLNVRSAPGASNPVVARLAPDDTATATGSSRQLDDGSVWDEVEVDGTTGWANSAFLSQAGAVDDITSRVVDLLAERPVEPTMEDLGRRVAAARSAGGEGEPTVTQVTAVSEGDLGEVTYDVIGFRDDSVEGERLHVFGTLEDGSFTLKSVEATTFCRRGVDDSGLCV